MTFMRIDDSLPNSGKRGTATPTRRLTCWSAPVNVKCRQAHQSRSRLSVRERQEMEPSEQVGFDIFDLIRDLLPICRSITGEGVRQSLRRLQQLIPLEVREVPSGTS